VGRRSPSLTSHDHDVVGIKAAKGKTMKMMTRIATSLMAVTMMTAPMMMAAQNSQNQSATQEDWMTPPAGSEQAQAYKDGIEAAKLDTVAKRTVEPTKSYLYNHPPVKSAEKEAYRNTFTQGYKAAVAHNNGNGGM
jgi:hypothetical protein